MNCSKIFDAFMVAYKINAIDMSKPETTEPYFRAIGGYVREFAKEKGLTEYTFRLLPDIGGIAGIQFCDEEMKIYEPKEFIIRET
jgi:hypothetical protein